MASRSQRHVLVFSPGGTPQALFEQLESHHWSVNLSDTIEQARDLLKRVKPHVGVVALDPEHVDSLLLEQLHGLLAVDAGINWIMLLPESGQLPTDLTLRLDVLISDFCFDYHHQPINEQVFLSVLGHAHGMAEIARHPSHISTPNYAQYGIIGYSPPMQALYRQISKVCKLDDPVLISGETGTGKELVANAIHYHSPRADKQLIVINCGSLAESLIQAELFGYEKGAFTGAYKRKIGRIEASDGGTLFLDEIGDLPLSQQANLLRFLQQRKIVRVGGYEEIPVNIRVVAATNIDLKQAVRDGRFREDLFYRLNVLHLEVPPLRERGEDIELLCRYFLNQDLSAASRLARGLSAEALQVIYQHEWKGNVRELANTIKHAQIMSEHRLIRPVDLELERRQRQRRCCTLEESRADADRNAIQDGLRQSRNNISQAADLLGISRVTLHRLISKYQLRVE